MLISSCFFRGPVFAILCIGCFRVLDYLLLPSYNEVDSFISTMFLIDAVADNSYFAI